MPPEADRVFVRTRGGHTYGLADFYGTTTMSFTETVNQIKDAATGMKAAPESVWLVVEGGRSIVRFSEVEFVWAGPPLEFVDRPA